MSLKPRESDLVPTVLQDADTGQVLMLAYSTPRSRELTRQEGRVWLYSRSRDQLWLKGGTSGNTMRFLGARLDCDGDALVYQVRPEGPACHTGEVSCFHREEIGRFREVHSAFSWESLYELIVDRKQNPVSGSYTSQLFERGAVFVRRKVGEEVLEVILTPEGDRAQLVEELADLQYHLLVLMAEMEVGPDDVLDSLARRSSGG